MRGTIVIILCLSFHLLSVAQEYEYTHTFFCNSIMQGDYFYSRAAGSGGSEMKNVNGRIPVCDTVFHTPGNSLVLQYQDTTGGQWQAVIYEAPKRGMDHFSNPAFLSFWIMSPSAMDSNEMPDVCLMKRDSSLTEAFTIPDCGSGKWIRAMVPLGSLGKDIIGVVFAGHSCNQAETAMLFIDDIELLPENTSVPVSESPDITSANGYAMHVDITWNRIRDKNVHLVKIYRSENGIDFHPVGVQKPYMNRYADFTGETGRDYFYRISFLNSSYDETSLSPSVRTSTRKMTDEELLSMVQEASFRYYWEGAEPNSGMARENIPGRQNMIATGASGFGIMALLAGTERGFISREESVGRFIRILDFLEKAETYHGAYPHFMDGITGKIIPFFGRRDNGADLVETSFLIQGLLAARQYFSSDNEREKMIRDKITGIWEGVEWDWFRRYPEGRYLYWHWSPDKGWVINHPLIGFNETMVTYLLAIASPTHPVPPELYYSGWASQDSLAHRYRSRWGRTTDGSMYVNGKTWYGITLDVGVSSGGPLFFTHYSYMGYDPHYITDKYTNYFTNNRNIARINYLYCLDNPKNFMGYGEGGWGLTASDGPYDYSADEPVAWQDHGKLTPTGAISSFPYTPDESMVALRNYYFNYGSFLWGEYGFRDSFSLSQNWCSEIYMGLNQAPMTVMIENFRTSLIWRMFMQISEIQTGLKRLTSVTALNKDRD